MGTLNLYARRAEAFSGAARQVGLILATHASIVVGAAQLVAAMKRLERHYGPGRGEPIAQAIGMLSAHMHIGLAEADEALARTAEKRGATPLSVAMHVIDTGGSLPEDAVDP